MALLVARAHDDAAATLQVVGRPVVPSYTAALHRFVDELGLHDAVTFRGALSDAALADAVADADVFVLASRHEGFGVPVLEAMASGVPVVANDAGALPEVVGDGGLLVDATDPYALAGAVARLRREAGLAGSSGAGCGAAHRRARPVLGGGPGRRPPGGARRLSVDRPVRRRRRPAAPA